MKRPIILGALVLAVLVAGFVILSTVTPEPSELSGILVDLEIEPRPWQYLLLLEALTENIPNQIPAFKGTKIRLSPVHFTELTRRSLDADRIDFVVLSPQGTPWKRYTGADRQALTRAMDILTSAVRRQDLPVLGVCGGHQFLAMAFGGEVDLIDPRFQGYVGDGYPAEAQSERGVTPLRIVEDDPILEGLGKPNETIRVFQSHYEEIKKLPAPFVNLAESSITKYQLIRLPGKPVYGVAFHPEACWNAGRCGPEALREGRTLLANFLSIALREKQERSGVFAVLRRVFRSEDVRPGTLCVRTG